MSKVQTVKLYEVAEIARGSSPRPIRNQAYFDGGTIPWVKIADATASTKFIYKTKQYVNDYGASFSRKLPPGSLIVAASGTLGFAIFLGVEACVHDGWLYFKHIDESRLDKDYLYHVLNGLTASFNAISYGAAIQNINTKILKQTEIPLPGLKVQKKVAATIAAYDDLIETNKRRISLLEKMAEELYREWFVRMRFPGYQDTKFVKGVPDGWERKPFGNFCMLKRGYDLPNALVEEGPYPVVASTSVKTFHKQYKVEPPVITTGRSGSLGEVLMTHSRAWPLNTALYVRKFFGNSPSLIFYTLKNMGLEKFNSGAGVPTLNRNHLNGIQMAVPDKRLQQRFEELVAPLHQQVETIHLTDLTLTQTRDLLLPRLISGKLSVEDLDIQFPPSMLEESTELEPAHA